MPQIRPSDWPCARLLLLYCKTDDPIEMLFGISGVGTMGTGGTLYPQVQDLYPCTPSERCGLCQNFKQTTLTTRLYKVRTNLYPQLRKRSDAPVWHVDSGGLKEPCGGPNFPGKGVIFFGGGRPLRCGLSLKIFDHLFLRLIIFSRAVWYLSDSLHWHSNLCGQYTDGTKRLARYDFLLVFYSDLRSGGTVVELQAVTVSRTHCNPQEQEQQRHEVSCEPIALWRRGWNI